MDPLGSKFFRDEKFKFNYIDLEKTLDSTLLDIADFKLEYNISSKNFKYVDKNVTFHCLFKNILNSVKYYNKLNGFKPVIYVVDSCLKQKPKSLIDQLKVIKRLLPIPFFIIKDKDLENSWGLLKELNMKGMDFYSNRKVKIKDLKKYLNDNGYSTLANTMSSIVNLKGFYY